MTATLSPCAKTKAKAKSTTKTYKPKASPKRAAPSSADDDKKKRKSRRKFDWDYAFLSSYFHMPQKEAAACLKVAAITIKRCCKRDGFAWPYRAMKNAAGKKPLLSAKELAFKRLPVDCMRENEDEMSECDTDTESVEDDEQERRDFSAILLSMHKTALV